MPILHPEVEAAPLGDLRALEAGIAPGAIRTLEDLQRLPYIRGVDLREVWQHHPHDVLCDPDVRIWFATSGTTGAPKGTPYGPPAAAGLPVEYTRPSPPQAAVTLSFLADRRPTAVIGFPSLLLRIAEGIAAEAPQAARAAWRDEPSLRTFAGVVATRMLRLQARHLYRPEIGLFGGEPLAPYRRPLLDAWGLRAYELYAMTEYPCFHVECPEQSGIHLWADWCIPEIIPLVRYRTGDVIEVLAVARCGCGRTHPRIRVRGRRDDLVNLGLIRFSAAELAQPLGGACGAKQL